MLSIILPSYNEEKMIPIAAKRLGEILTPESIDYELVFVDDGSRDSTWQQIQSVSAADAHVVGVHFSRNFGKEAAMFAGLEEAKGDCCVVIDCDLQHPPEKIVEMYRLWEQGYEVVQTIRKTTEGVSAMKKLTSYYYYKVLNKLSNVHIQEGGSDFRLMDRVVVKAFRRYREHARFIRGMIGAMGFRQVQIEFVAPKRFAGVSKFSPRKMLNFAIDGVLAYSNLPLRLGLYIGTISGIISLLLIIHVFVSKYVLDDAVAGWATLTALVLFFGGMQMIVLGILGEYLGRVFEEVKHRPLYLIARGKPKDEMDRD